MIWLQIIIKEMEIGNFSRSSRIQKTFAGHIKTQNNLKHRDSSSFSLYGVECDVIPKKFKLSRSLSVDKILKKYVEKLALTLT